MMKKRSKGVVVGVAMLLVGLLTGCGKDPYAGVAEITVNDEKVDITTGFDNVDDATYHPYVLRNAKKATVRFLHEECQYDETIELVAPETKMFRCNCGKPAYFEIMIGKDVE